MSDEKCLEVFSELLATRVKLGTAYVSDPDTGILTHQFLLISCGDLKLTSAPEELSIPLQPVMPEGEVLN